MESPALAALRAVVLHESSAADRQSHAMRLQWQGMRDRIWLLQCALARIARGADCDECEDPSQEAAQACYAAGMDCYSIDVLAGFCEDTHKLNLSPEQVERDFRGDWEDDIDEEWDRRERDPTQPSRDEDEEPVGASGLDRGRCPTR